MSPSSVQYEDVTPDFLNSFSCLRQYLRVFVSNSVIRYSEPFSFFLFLYTRLLILC